MCGMQAKQAMKYPERLRIYVTRDDMKTGDNARALSRATLRALERHERAWWYLDSFPFLADVVTEQDPSLEPVYIGNCRRGKIVYPKRRMVRVSVLEIPVCRYTLPPAANMLLRPMSLRLRLVMGPGIAAGVLTEGGLPAGKFSEVYGPETADRSTLIQHAMKASAEVSTWPEWKRGGSAAAMKKAREKL
jgi:hypothetical protein